MRTALVLAIALHAHVARADATAPIKKLVTNQIDVLRKQTLALDMFKPIDEKAIDALFLPDAVVVTIIDAYPPIATAHTANIAWLEYRGTHDEQQLAITMARDGKSAWLSFVSRLHLRDKQLEYRVSEVAVKTDAGWRIAAAMFSLPQPNDAVNKAAADNKLQLPKVAPGDVDSGNGELLFSFLNLQDKGVDATAAANKELVVFGSGPGERLVGGAPFAKAWSASWKNHVPLAAGAIATVSPSGTTGWVVTDIFLEKKTADGKTYLVPFRLFFVYDKTATGEWTLVHAHIATIEPKK